MSGEQRTYRLREDDLTWRDADGTTIVLDGRKWVYLKLNGSGAVLWSRLATGATLQDLTAALCDAYDIDDATARQDVEEFLAMLTERELVAP
jgi:hypothetical protein